MKIAVDFDGTCVKHAYPDVGEDMGAAPVLKMLADSGHELILWTVRSGDRLQDAVDWFARHDIELYGVNINPDQHRWTSSPKVYAELYIDDAALGIPLVIPAKGRPYVDWYKVRVLLAAHKLL